MFIPSFVIARGLRHKKTEPHLCDEVRVYNVNSSKYDIADKRKIIDANKHSEPFLMWINGEPYV